MDQIDNQTLLQQSLSQLEAASTNFAHRFINDGSVRQSYIQQTRRLSEEYRTLVSSGVLSPEDAAKQVQTIRNEILDAQRLRSSDIGRARAIDLKKSGLTLNDLTTKYAKDMFGQEFARLSDHQRDKVFLEIVESAGRQRPRVNASALRLSRLGRGLVVSPWLPPSTTLPRRQTRFRPRRARAW